MIKKILVLLLISLLIVTYGFLITHTFAQQEEKLTITTYYPSPYGSYRELTAYRMKIGRTFSGSGYTIDDDNLIVEGRVAIGSSIDTGTKLLVYGPATAGSRTLTVTDGATSTLELGLATQSTAQRPYVYANTNLAFGTNGAERMVINNIGNVGIGTASPLEPLHIEFGPGTGDKNYLRFNQTNGFTPGTGQWIVFGQGTTPSQNFRVGYFYDSTAGSLFQLRNSSDTPMLSVHATGNVGIGTTDLGSFKLKVTGGGGIRAEISANGEAADMYAKTSGAYFGTNSVGTDMIFMGGGTEWMRIKNGNVGIGTVSPQAKLDVAGRIKVGTTGATPPGFGNTLSWGGGAAACTIGTLWVEDNGVTAQLCFCGRRSGGSFRYCW